MHRLKRIAGHPLPPLFLIQAGVFAALAAGNAGRPFIGNGFTYVSKLSNAAPFYLTVGARYAEHCHVRWSWLSQLGITAVSLFTVHPTGLGCLRDGFWATLS